MLGSLQLHAPRMWGFRQTKSARKAGVVQEGLRRRPKTCVLRGRVCQKGVFVSSGKFQTNHYMEQRGKNKERPRARRPLRGPLTLSTVCRPCGGCELGHCGQSQLCVEETCLVASQFLLPCRLALA